MPRTTRSSSNKTNNNIHSDSSIASGGKKEEAAELTMTVTYEEECADAALVRYLSICYISCANINFKHNFNTHLIWLQLIT